MYALKRNDFIFITGQCGSAKSSLIRLVERTINKQMSTDNVSQLKNSSVLFLFIIHELCKSILFLCSLLFFLLKKKNGCFLI
jgi:ABC-type lipoprotein export system ATPase subunit